jgi:hypothetical protein
MSCRQVWLEWILLFSWVSLSQAQWQARQSINNTSDTCRDIQVTVKDCNGFAIEGAVVSAENTEGITDSRGTASISCGSQRSVFTVIEARAAGYRTARVPFQFDSTFHFEVRLEKENPAVRPAAKTISARELSGDARAKSFDLQKQAGDALARGDYASAESLLLRAFDLTPSSASILNNLGVAAARRNNLDAAETWFEKAIQADPHKAEAIGNLALVRWKQHRSEESYNLLSKAASMKYETNPGNYIMGTVCMEKGLYREAVYHLKKVAMDQFPLRDLYLSLALYNCGKVKAAAQAHNYYLRHRHVPFALSTLPRQLS